MTEIEDYLLDTHLIRVKTAPKEIEEITKFLEEGKAPHDISTNKKNILSLKAMAFTLMNGYLYNIGSDDIIRIFALEHER